MTLAAHDVSLVQVICERCHRKQPNQVAPLYTYASPCDRRGCSHFYGRYTKENA